MEKILNKEDCEEIVKNYLKVDGNVVVHRFQILPLSDEYPGFCADYCRLKIMFNDVSYYMRILKLICIEKNLLIFRLMAFKKLKPFSLKFCQY